MIKTTQPDYGHTLYEYIAYPFLLFLWEVYTQTKIK